MNRVQFIIVTTLSGIVALCIFLQIIFVRLLGADQARLRDTVLSDIGHGFRLEFVYCDEIERTAGGKYLEFRCDVPDDGER